MTREGTKHCQPQNVEWSSFPDSDARVSGFEGQLSQPHSNIGSCIVHCEGAYVRKKSNEDRIGAHDNCLNLAKGTEWNQGKQI